MSKKSGVNKKNLLFALFVLLLIVDQISKELVTFWVPPSSSIPLIGKFVYLTPVKNKGLIMGFFSNSVYLAVFLPILVMMVFIFFSLLKLRKKGNLGIVFIISGATGNLLDRVFRGGVIDFIDIRFWPIFNLGDIFITSGTVLLCLDLIFHRKKCTE